MKFSKVIGVCDRKLLSQAEDKLSSIFTELALGYKILLGTKLGGDVFLHQLISPLPHICDARAVEFEEVIKKIDGDPSREIIEELKGRLGKNLLYTAATDGKRYYWNPEFVIKQSKIGLRLIVAHEGWHAIYMHPARRGSRNPKLWNIAVDFKVNFTIMDDLRTRGIYNPVEVFKKELGDFVTLEEYAAFLRNPFDPPKKMALWNPINELKERLGENQKLPEEGNATSFFYAEPDLKDHLKRPENIYDYLISQIPKCKCCGRLGAWKHSKEYKELLEKYKAKLKDEQGKK